VQFHDTDCPLQPFISTSYKPVQQHISLYKYALKPNSSKVCLCRAEKKHPVSFCAACNGSFEISAIRFWKETKKQHLHSVQRNLFKKNHWSFRQLKRVVSKQWGFIHPQLLPCSLLETVRWVSTEVPCKTARCKEPHKNWSIYDNAVTRNICWQKWWKDAKHCHLSGEKWNVQFGSYLKIIWITFRRLWNNQTQTWVLTSVCWRYESCGASEPVFVLGVLDVSIISSSCLR